MAQNAPDKVRVGLVLPETAFGEAEWKNAERCLDYALEAGRAGVELLLFPEGYPGPMTGPTTDWREAGFPFDPMAELKKVARDFGMHVLAGDVVATATPEVYVLALHVLGPDGQEIATYVRQQPDTPPLNAYLYNGKAHLVPGTQGPLVLDAGGYRLGTLICSELWVPELARLLMLRGAEVVAAPVHGNHSRTRMGSLRDTWHCIARARAAENLAYVLVTQNLYLNADFDYREQLSVGAVVAGPEQIEAFTDVPGLLTCDLDLARLRFLRSRNFDEELMSRPDGEDFVPVRCRPGQIWERNPALYRELAEPSPYSFDYDYLTKDRDAWLDAYERIYGGAYRGLVARYGGNFRFQER